MVLDIMTKSQFNLYNWPPLYHITISKGERRHGEDYTSKAQKLK